jgi:hypothetical protein
MERRTFVKLSAYTAIALALPLAESCTPASVKIAAQPYLFSHITDKKTLIDVGIAYRKSFPAEDGKDNLIQLLTGNNAKPDKQVLEQLLDRNVVNDFKAGKTVVVNGWILSLTEARQCALYSILNA